MSVASETSKVNYISTGLAAYTVPFKFNEGDHLEVYVDDVIKVLDTDYTVTGAGEEDGGEVTFGVAPDVDARVTIRRNVPLLQESSFNDGGPNDAESFEALMDKLVMIDQQQSEALSRAALLPVSSTMDGTLPSGLQPGETIIVNEDGDGFERGPTADEIEAAQTYAGNASDSADAAAASASAAQAAETNAETAQAAAEAARDVAQLAANSVIFQDQVFITFANSPLTLDESYRGAMINCDCSGGPIIINLPEIATLELDYPFTVAIKKTDSSGNSVTVNPGGTDEIDEGASKTIGSASSGAVFMPDTDPDPDGWTTAEFGASAGNLTVDNFVGDGSTVAFALSVAPGSENNTQVFIGGVYQQKDTYSLTGTTLTLDDAPESGVTIEVVSGTSLSIGTPSDNTVSTAKIIDEAVTEAKLSSAVQEKLNNEYVFVEATNTSGQSIPNTTDTTVTGWTEVKDTVGAFNPTTGVFTAPSDGLYRVSPHLLLEGASSALGGRAILAVGINSGAGLTRVITLAPSIGAGGYNLFPLSGFVDLDLLEGDEVTININQSTGASRALNASTINSYLTISRSAGRFA